MTQANYQISVNFEQILSLVNQLSADDKIRLFRKLEKENLTKIQVTPRRSLLGLCKTLGQAPSEEDIDEIRQEMWSNFAGDDF
jgi:hypothetical protein